MSHQTNFDVVKELLKNNYVSFTGPSIPKKADLTFDNKYKKIENAVVVYLDMRHSRKIMFKQNEYRSLKTHRAFLQSFISCIDALDGKFRSFNGDGALAFFHGENASSRAVRASMNFNNFVSEMNNILLSKDMLAVDYGIGIAKGTIYVAKTGKKGAGDTRQDLIWVGYPTYLAVELSDMGKSPYHLWISSTVHKNIIDDDSTNSYKVYTSNGVSMWQSEDIKLSDDTIYKAYKTNYFFDLGLE